MENIENNITDKEWIAGAFIYFIDHELTADAKVIAKKYIERYPEEYMGYHMLNQACRMSGNWTDMRDLPDQEERFKEEENYWNDVLEFVYHENADLGVLSYLREHTACKEHFPEVYYREMMGALAKLELFDEYHAVTKEYCDRMIPAGSKIHQLIALYDAGELLEAGGLANQIMASSDEESYDFNMALLMQMQILLELSGDDLTKEQEEILRKMAGTYQAWCQRRTQEEGSANV